MPRQARFTTEQLCKKLSNKLQGCKDRGISFELTLTQFERLMKTRKCFYTGKQMDGKHMSLYYVTLDRIDPNLPYTPANTVACSWIANQAKSRMFEDPKEPNIKLTEAITLCNKLAEIGFKPRD